MISLPRCRVALAVLLLSAGWLRAAKDDHANTAVFATVHNGYQRARGPDGQYRAETYAFVDGGRVATKSVDRTMEQLPFRRIAELLAEPLAQRRYINTMDAEKTDLLVIVYYGRTAGTAGSSDSAAHHQLYSEMGNPGAQGSDMLSADGGINPGGRHPLEGLLTQIGIENDNRRHANWQNAKLLGYHEELERTDTIAQYSAGGTYRNDLIADVEEDRYFVILVACDFRLATREKKLKPLWSTRFNIAARRRDFEKSLPAMSYFASRYFGRGSDGLLRETVPVGEVEVKDLIHLGEAPKK